jgi:hypothetical protein
MIFRGLGPDNVGLRISAAARATTEDRVTFWTKAVGIDAVPVFDHTLFRWLEWRGMQLE